MLGFYQFGTYLTVFSATRVVSPRMGKLGWPFASVDPYPGADVDDFNHVEHIKDLYLKADPDYPGRYTSNPHLWVAQIDQPVPQILSSCPVGQSDLHSCQQRKFRDYSNSQYRFQSSSSREIRKSRLVPVWAASRNRFNK